MGQARARGTKDERDAMAIEAIRVEQEARRIARDRKEAEQEAIRAAKWEAMTQAERDAALVRAGDEMAMHADLAGMIGWDAAGLMMDVFAHKKA